MNRRHGYYLLAGLLVVASIVFFSYPRGERTIEITECTKCSGENCEVKQNEKFVEKYIITSKLITVYIRNRDGRVLIQELHEPDRCKILPSEGFAFDCRHTMFSNTNGVDHILEYEDSYNGSDTFIEKRSERRFVQGRSESTNNPLFNYTRTCKVK